MRITDTVLVRGMGQRPDHAQRREFVQEMRDSIALLQALTEKAQREIFCRRTLAEMRCEIFRARQALANIERA